MPKQPSDIPAVMPGEPLYFLVSPGINAVQDSRAQRPALLIHRQAVRPQGAGSDTAYLFRGNTAGFNQVSGYPAEIPPPHLICIMFKPPLPWMTHSMGHGMFRCHPEIFPYEHSSGFIGSNVNSHKILFQSSHLLMIPRGSL